MDLAIAMKDSLTEISIDKEALINTSNYFEELMQQVHSLQKSFVYIDLFIKLSKCQKTWLRRLLMGYEEIKPENYANCPKR